MFQHNDLTFFTNEPNKTLLDRFNKVLGSHTKFFDVLVGYFRTSGFYKMYPAMESVEKIRILVGLNIDKQTVQLIHRAEEEQLVLNLSYKEAKDEYKKQVKQELERSEDKKEVELGIQAFIDFINSGKLEIRVYPHAPIHAKVYIMRKDLEKVPDMYGSVITGSSNFSAAGLVNNLEFNVELKDSRDVQFALDSFDELWRQSIPVSDEYIDTIYTDTWLRNDITPYELYLKSLYEYFKEEINEDKSFLSEQSLPDGFMPLQYQVDAVNRAKKILDAYNGVFISDVVGLGKTFICALLAQKLRGRKLVICPPVLKRYWESVLEEFEVSARVESLGKLDRLLDEGVEGYKYIFIDEAHRFRNQGTESFKKLHQICLNKKVVLISATPQNNYSSDIANQIYLFQAKNNSTIIPNQKNLEAFFSKLDIELKKQEKGSIEYLDVLRKNSQKIRDNVLRNIMVRRTRKEINKYYEKDLKKQGLKFPHLEMPQRIVYVFDKMVETVFQKTINTILSLSYARYRPLTYLFDVPKEYASMITAQRNMHGFMKAILVKRLESSFFAFKKTLGRFIESHEKFISMCKRGEVYISKKIDVYDLLDSGDDEKLLNLVEEETVQHFNISEFSPEFLPSLENDLMILKRLQNEWNKVDVDPKLEQFKKDIRSNVLLKNKQLIIFTESKETAEYLGEQLEDIYPEKVVVYTGQSGQILREEIEANFNPRFKKDRQKNDILLLITTDVLAEGINLHRSNVIVNYDLPWNPTKIMQRVGRINRVGTSHENIYVFNFFPTDQSNAHLPLEQNIVAKIQAFHDTLGEDFKYLTEDEEVVSHQLFGQDYFNFINSKESLEVDNEIGEESDLKYLTIIRDIRDNNVDLFEKIKRLPKKARSGRNLPKAKQSGTVTFLRKGSLKKFFLSSEKQAETKELTFHNAMNYIEVQPDEPFFPIDEEYYEQLTRNKEGFVFATTEEENITIETKKRNSQDSQLLKVLKILSKQKTFTDIQEEQIEQFKLLWENGVVPATVTKNILKQIKGKENPVQVFYTIVENIPDTYLHYREKKSSTLSEKSEVILSLYLTPEG